MLQLFFKTAPYLYLYLFLSSCLSFRPVIMKQAIFLGDQNRLLTSQGSTCITKVSFYYWDKATPLIVVADALRDLKGQIGFWVGSGTLCWSDGNTTQRRKY